MTLRRRATLAALLAALLAAGCSGPSNRADPASPATVTTAEPDPSEGRLDETTSTTEPELDEVAMSQGVAFTWTDGLAVSVVKVQRAKISESASGGNPARHDNLVLTVKMTAREATTGELNITTTLHYGKDGREAEAVFDDEGYGGIATDFMQEHPAKLRKGRSLTGRFGFAVPKGEVTKIVFTFSPGHGYADATFSGLR